MGNAQKGGRSLYNSVEDGHYMSFLVHFDEEEWSELQRSRKEKDELTRLFSKKKKPF